MLIEAGKIIDNVLQEAFERIGLESLNLSHMKGHGIYFHMA